MIYLIYFTYVKIFISTHGYGTIFPPKKITFPIIIFTFHIVYPICHSLFLYRSSPRYNRDEVRRLSPCSVTRVLILIVMGLVRLVPTVDPLGPVPNASRRFAPPILVTVDIVHLIPQVDARKLRRREIL